GGRSHQVTVDRRLASLWYGWSIQPVGWALPAPRDPIAGDYEAADGWIRLHTNAPHHRAAALAVLSVTPECVAVARSVAGWRADARAGRASSHPISGRLRCGCTAYRPAGVGRTRRRARRHHWQALCSSGSAHSIGPRNTRAAAERNRCTGSWLPRRCAGGTGH